MEELVSSLHNLEGNSVGEKFKNLNQFINNLKSSNHNIEFIHSVIASFSPRNELEKLIKVRLIDSFQIKEEIINLIRSGDLFLITWALKCDWFFVSNEGKELEFFRDLFPDLSYSLRYKVIKRYSKFLKDPKTGDLLFEFLKDTYGLYTAALVLPACSESFIEKVLDNHFKYIPASIFTQLYDLYPSLLIKFVTNVLKRMEESKAQGGFYRFDTDKYEDIFRKIATENTQLFMSLFEGYMDTIRYSKFGLRLARKVVKTDINSVIKNARLYCKIISVKHIVKVLSRSSEENIMNFHLALLPSTISEFFSQNNYFQDDHFEMLRYVEPTLREKMIVNNFTRAYGESIETHLNRMSLNLVEMLPASIKEQWAKYHLSQISNESDYSYYSLLPTAEAISKLKVIIRGEVQADKRRDIIDSMFDSVKRTDYDTLLELIEYVVKNYRNDTLVRTHAVEKLNHFRLSQLDASRWKPINELLNLITIFNDTSSVAREMVNILSMYVHSRLDKNMDVNEQLEWIMKIPSYCFSFRIAEGTPHDKYCLKWFLDYMQKQDLEKKKDSVITLFLAVHSWNKGHLDNKISYPDWITDAIYNYLTSSDYIYEKDEILRAIKLETEIKQKMYNRFFMKIVLHDILMDRLRLKPTDIVSDIDRIMGLVLKDSIQAFRPFFNKVKLLSALELPEKVVGICKTVFCDKENSSWLVRRNSIFILSLLMPTKDYVQLIVPYYPTKSSVDDFSTESQDVYSMQTVIAKNFKNCNNPLELFEPIRKFAVGDYLKLIVGSMSSLFLKSAQHKVMEIVMSWMDCPVSVRKHLIRGYCRVAPIDNTLSFLLKLFTNEKNLSLRVYMFQSIFKHFMSETNTKTWTTLKAAIANLKVTDKDGISMVIKDIGKIEECYILEYLEMIWNTVHNFEDLEPERIAFYQKDIIQSISGSQVKYLSEEFCDKLLSHFSLEIGHSLQECLLSFSVYYLIASLSEEQLKERFKRVMQIIELIIKSGWDRLDIKNPPVCPARSLVQSFINTLVLSTRSGVNPKRLLIMFKDCLLDLVDETTLFSDIMFLRMRIAFHEANESHVGGEGNTFSTFIVKISQIIDEYCQRFGGEIVPLVTSLINDIVHWHDHTVPIFKRSLLISELLLSNSTSKYCQMVAIELISDDVTSLEKCIDEYTEILNKLSAIKDPSVKIYFNKHLKALH